MISTAIRSYLSDFIIRSKDHRTLYESIFKMAHAIRAAVHEVSKPSPSFLNLKHIVPPSRDSYVKLKDFEEEDHSLTNR